jgi:hypothetical protein
VHSWQKNKRSAKSQKAKVLKTPKRSDQNNTLKICASVAKKNQAKRKKGKRQKAKGKSPENLQAKRPK